MSRYCELILIFGLLFVGFILLLMRMEVLKRLHDTLLKAKLMVEQQDKRAKLERRRLLTEFESKNSLWIWLERQIEYSGMKRRVKGVTAGSLLVVNLIVFGGMVICGSVMGNVFAGVLIGLLILAVEFMVFQVEKARNLSVVSEELPKFLDFLGSYSLSSGELTSIFSQISRYLRSPISDALEEFDMETRISGDTRLALISMGDKIEHPQFKQLIRNLEISLRYSADFTALVSDSRRSLREYLSQTRDRKGMIREAGINMLLLLLMSVIVLITVNMLIEGSIWQILFGTMVGHIALGGMIFIFTLFGIQAFSMNK